MADRRTTGHQFTMSIQAVITNILVNGSSSAAIDKQFMDVDLDDGVELNQVSRAWSEKFTINTGNSVDIDLSDFATRNLGAGLGNDAIGLPCTLEEIVGISIQNENSFAKSGVLQVNSTLAASPWAAIPLNASANALGGAIRPGGARGWFEPSAAGLDITGTSTIRLTATGGNVDVSIVVFGRHDDEASSSSSSSSISSASSTSLSSTSSSTTP